MPHPTPPRPRRTVTLVTYLFAIACGLAVLLAPPLHRSMVAVGIATVAVPLMAIVGGLWADHLYWEGRRQARAQALDLVEGVSEHGPDFLTMLPPHQAPPAGDEDWRARSVGSPDYPPDRS